MLPKPKIYECIDDFKLQLVKMIPKHRPEKILDFVIRYECPISKYRKCVQSKIGGGQLSGIPLHEIQKKYEYASTACSEKYKLIISEEDNQHGKKLSRDQFTILE